MSRLLGLLLVGAIAFSAVEATRAADGQISDAQLASLGLGGMPKMSDEQGMAVRGKFVFSPLAIAQISTIQFNALQGSFGTQGATFFATGTAAQLFGINLMMENRFPNGVGGFGTTGVPGLRNPYIVPSISGQPGTSPPLFNFLGLPGIPAP